MDQLLTIGTFGRAVGLPPSALRHYADLGILVPTEVDASSGYRYYAPDQLRTGDLVSRLRRAEVPLPLVQQVVTSAPEVAARLLGDFGQSLDQQVTRRHDALSRVVDTLQQSATQSVRTTVLPGPVLGRALVQVMAAAARDVASEVSGVVWDLHEDRLTLMATDRYWLVHRRLPVTATGARASAMTGVAETEHAARAVARCTRVQVRVSAAGIGLHRLDGSPLVDLPAVRRDVPDLELLVTRQSPPGTVLGFLRADLLTGLASLPPAGPTPIHVDGDRAVLGGPPPPLLGWAASEPAHPPPAVLVQPALLAAAAGVCPGGEVLIWVPDHHAPLIVTSPDQDSLTVLVMPMRA